MKGTKKLLLFVWLTSLCLNQSAQAMRSIAQLGQYCRGLLLDYDKIPASADASELSLEVSATDAVAHITTSVQEHAKGYAAKEIKRWERELSDRVRDAYKGKARSAIDQAYQEALVSRQETFKANAIKVEENRNRAATENLRILQTVRSFSDPTKTKYIPQGYLGSGAYGFVIKAYDRDLKKMVAIKIAYHKFLPTKEVPKPRIFESDFADEHRYSLLAQKRFGNEDSPLPVTYDLIQRENSLFHSMELLEGQSLDKRFHRINRERVLDQNLIRDDLKLLAQSAEQIKKLHALGFLHLDIKFDNIANGERGAVLLDAAGLIKLRGNPPRASRAPIVYSRNYAAPEVRSIDGKPDITKIGPAADVYTFATMLDETLTEWKANINQYRPTPIESRLLTTIENLRRTLVKHGTEVDPQFRPSIDLFIAELQKAANEHAVPLPIPQLDNQPLLPMTPN